MARLIAQIPIKVTIELLTGLHIGAGKEQIKIGGIDSPVVKLHLKDNKPYIPGSSLKGKLRFLLEVSDNKIGENGSVHKFNRTCISDKGYLKCDICKYFGMPADALSKYKELDTDKIVPITRFIFRDLELNEEWNKRYNEFQQDIEHEFYEEKIEVQIKRDNGKATPRYIERVPAGVIFEGKLLVRVFDVDLERADIINETKDLNDKSKEEYIEEYYNKELRPLLDKLENLLENDYLGGQGSRGYGAVKIKFELDKINQN